jgi:hypothetical protein
MFCAGSKPAMQKIDDFGQFWCSRCGAGRRWGRITALKAGLRRQTAQVMLDIERGNAAPKKQRIGWI